MSLRQKVAAFLRNYKVSVPTLAVVCGLVGWVAFGYFGVHLLFIDDKVSEAAPSAAVATQIQGSFESRAHTTVGTATVLDDGSGKRLVRFEDFKTDNGPDLNVYLVNRAAGEAKDFVDLGDLKGNVGAQNYEIPAGTALDKYDTVVVWCVRFSVAFGEAKLQNV